MEFEWDDTKRLIVLEKHGIDFLDLAGVWDSFVVIGESNRGEARWLAMGLLRGREVTLVYTLRGGRIRMISARRARTDERRPYHARHSG